VVVYAQEEARLHGHNYIGTEHILLGLLREEESVGAKALAALGVSLADARQRVEVIIGTSAVPPAGHIPFTPRAKRILEFALREALQVRHNYIGTEHLLLALLREGEGVACQVLTELGVSLDLARQKVIELMTGVPGPAREGPATMGAGAPANVPLCPGCRRSLEGALRGRRLEATGERDESHQVFVVFCGMCGYAIDTFLVRDEPDS
jgi:ATP-dependent Clp protease ATP-binding subunit ClpC